MADEKKTPEQVPDWTKGKSVSSFAEAVDETVVLETKMDSTIPMLEFSWFAVKATSGNSNVEEQEKLVAIKHQIALGIINTDGSPTSTKKKDKLEVPKKLPGGKLARKALRMRDKSIIKDMAKQQRQMSKMVVLNNQTKSDTPIDQSILNRLGNRK